MSNRFPSMTALLGLLAVAGYQNRDKLGQWLSGLQGNTAGATPGGQQSGQQGGLGGIQQGGLGGILGNLAQSLGGSGGATTGGFLNGGLSELVERFQKNGQPEVANSWVSTGANKEVSPDQLEQALGPDVIANLQQQTGLSREELLARLSTRLPEAVDKYTPDGRLPT